MSDCQSWFGSARSKRVSGCSRSVGRGCCSSSPSSCRIRRTSVSLTPSASNRSSSALIRLVPYSGCSIFSCFTAARFGSLADFARGFFPGRFGLSPSSPPLSYALCQAYTHCRLRPNARATSPQCAPPFTACTTSNRNSSDLLSAPAGAFLFPFLVLLLATVCSFSPLRPAGAG